MYDDQIFCEASKKPVHIGRGLFGLAVTDANE